MIHGFFKLNVRSLLFAGIVNHTGKFNSIVVKTLKPIFYFTRSGVPLILKNNQGQQDSLSVWIIIAYSQPLLHLAGQYL